MEVIVSRFPDWLSAQLEHRGWNNKELAQRSGMSPAAVSQVMTGRQKPGVEFCLGVSDALKEPPTKVFRLAGLLPESRDTDEVLEDIVYYYAMLSPEARARLQRFARALAEGA
jgi:transcriptional regulator with XRE-family HTH domain